MNEDELCRKKLIDLSKQADRRGIVLFSTFLNLNEQNIYHQSGRFFATRTECFGGIPHAERQMIAFIPDALSYEWDYPIAALKISPAHPKFAEPFGHRDILGALMTLGVDRGKVGDIVIDDGNAFFLCEEGMADFFVENLEKIRHTAVKLKRIPPSGLSVRQEFTEQEGTVASTRLDSVLACVYRLSRSQAAELFRAEKVFVDGRMVLNPSHSCDDGSIISVRGYGRFLYQQTPGETKKGRLKIRYLLYQ